MKKIKINSLVSRVLCLATIMLYALCIETTAQNREFRATWLTTVWGIDWPKTTIPVNGTEAQKENARKQQKKELCNILDSLKEANMNATFFQVRGMSDAMYKSKYENWCRYLTGTRGADPGYDPLEFAIQEAHKRGIELHAWLNPYRYSSSEDTYSSLENDYAAQHPDWILDYGSGTTILDPGLPEVRQRIQEIIADIVERYDVDGIVFDDYFYAYGGTSTNLDKATQDKYRPEGKDLGDWRRENVDMMIKDVYDTIQAIKPYVKFGVSPFGTWTTNKEVAKEHGITLPGGVGQTGNMYAEIYCDPIAWLEQGTVDYISPQLYWTTTSAYPFGILSNWWSEISSRFGRHFYASHSVSALNGSASPAPQRRGLSNIESQIVETQYIASQETSPEVETQYIASQEASQEDETQYIASLQGQKRSFKQGEIGAQINYNRMYDVNDAPGSVMYNTNKTVNTKSFIQYLKLRVYTTKILTPHINWKDNSVPASPTDFVKTDNLLTWKNESPLYRTAVYAIPEGYSGVDKYAPKHLIDLVFDSLKYEIPAEYAEGYTFALTAVNRYGAESAPVVLNGSVANPAAPALVYPLNDAAVLMPCLFKWEQNTAEWAKYQWQLAKDEQFDSLVATRTVDAPEFNTTVMYNIVDGGTYYWRVRTINEGGASDWSEARKFTSKLFGFNSPENNAADLEQTPLFTWDDASNYGAPQYTFEISSGIEFNAVDILYSATLSENQLQVPDGVLVYSTTYYARVSVVAGTVSAVSPTLAFTTKDIEIPVPTILSPRNGETFDAKSILLTWAEQPANGFRVELSTSSKFPSRSTTVRTTDAYTFEYEFTGLKYTTYYLRMKADKPHGYSTAYSDTVMVTLSDVVSIEPLNENGKARIVALDDNNLTIYADFCNKNLESVAVYSVAGQKITGFVEIRNEQNNNITFNISNLPQGVYLLKICYKTDFEILKFQK